MIGGQRHYRQIWLQAEDSKKEESSSDAMVELAQNDTPDESAEPGDFLVDLRSTAGASEAQDSSADQSSFIAADESCSTDDLPPLEVGTPGDFSSAIHNHNEKSDLSVSSEGQPEPGSPDFLTMLDEPLPDSIGGGSAAVQSMFVEEVLRTAKSSEMEQVDEQSTLPSVEFGPKSDTSNDLTLATAVSSLAVSGELDQPDSPRVSELKAMNAPTPPAASDQDVSTKVVQGSTKINVSDHENQQLPDPEGKTKVAGKTDSEKTVVGNSTGKKEKSSKKNSSAAKIRSEKKAKKAEEDVVAPLSQTEVTIVNPNKRRKELRIALGVLVTCVALAAVLIVTKKFFLMEQSEQPKPLTKTIESEKNLPEVIDLEKGTVTTRTEEETLSTDKSGAAEAQSVALESSKIQVKNKKLNAKDDVVTEMSPAPSGDDRVSEVFEDADRAEQLFVLTRPDSRYTETNAALRPLIDIVVALDKVQPRKVLNLLKQLPESFASNNAVERAALREVTARYYLQVGAYAKAVKLFREVCLDPKGSSEIEMCLHAARGFVVTGQFEDAEALLDLLKIRATRDSLWGEWVKVLEAAQALSQPTTARFVDFIDEISEKAPFMTSEWNLQLSTFFSRKFAALGRADQLEILRRFDKRRRKTVEVRLAPLRYGSDIGSYMLPSFLNLYFRLFELPELTIDGEDPETDSQTSLVSWTFFVVSQSKANELRQTRARLAPLFAERAFAPLARVIEAHLAAQSGDFLGASALMSEQVNLQPALQVVLESKEDRDKNAAVNFLKATQRFEQMPFLFVEWLYLGVKVASGLNDLSFMTTVLTALESVSKRYPEIQYDFQYWNILARGYRALGKLADLRNAVRKAEAMASTKHEMGFVTGYKVWLLMKSRKEQQAKALLKEGLRQYPHHARLLEFGAEFASQWGEDPAYYLGLESDIPRQFQNRGRDRTLLSLFTISKLLNKF